MQVKIEVIEGTVHVVGPYSTENNGPRRWEVKLLYRVLQCNIGDIMDYVPDEPTKEEVRG
jgi:hypothetical protein